jgi:hypothetical protein
VGSPNIVVAAVTAAENSSPVGATAVAPAPKAPPPATSPGPLPKPTGAFEVFSPDTGAVTVVFDRVFRIDTGVALGASTDELWGVSSGASATVVANADGFVTMDFALNNR